ncbi:hypothetical protein [Nannocystis pusilla]|uniref:hypothetical protein n=1 Tax=Nannocystis pusilla TaxID=889268 RepID=UPI003B75E855
MSSLACSSSTWRIGRPNSASVARSWNVSAASIEATNASPTRRIVSSSPRDFASV